MYTLKAITKEALPNALAKAALVCPEPALPAGKVKIMFWGRWDQRCCEMLEATGHIFWSQNE